MTIVVMEKKVMRGLFIMGVIAFLVLLCSACQDLTLSPPTQTASPCKPSASATLPATPVPSETPSATPTRLPTSTPSASSTATASVTPTLKPLAYFASPSLRPGVIGQAYLAETCEYLRLRWGEGKAEPGTVVVPVMFHSIVQPPSKVTDPKDITVEDFQAFVNEAAYLGFKTITTRELLNFLLYNDPIPKRSMIMIVDDRRPGLIQEHFMPILEVNDWTVTPAYITDLDSLEWAWDWMERMYESGRLDVQSHGYSGQLYILPETPLEQIQREIWDSTQALEAHFGVRPIAFIWPGGNFTPLSVEVAREGGYQLGFTAYSRGPLLFNWIPLGEEERLVNEPLMVLPRAWSNSVNYNLDEAIKISEQAVAFADANAQAEQEWLQMYCGGK